MRATAQLQGFSSESCKYIIVRNVSRILDVRILDIDVERRTVSFVYDSVVALEKAKRELWRIGFPVLKCQYQDPNEGRDRIIHDARSALAN